VAVMSGEKTHAPGGLTGCLFGVYLTQKVNTCEMVVVVEENKDGFVCVALALFD
jgi:hypothetical protein